MTAVEDPVSSDDVGERGEGAHSPAEIPAKGWKDVARRVKDQIKEDNVSLLAGGVAFFALVASVPALVALVSIYGLVADPTEISRQIDKFGAALPDSAQDLLREQLLSITQSSGTGLGVGAVIGLIAALWTASNAIKHVFAALNGAYDVDETRKFLKLRGLSLLVTLGAVVFFVMSIFVVAVLPAVLADTALGDAARVAVSILRWPALAIAMVVALGVIYRVGPDRGTTEWRWITPGAIVATALWLVASLGFSFYAANLGSYNETYGSLGAVIVLMLWLFITAFTVILGAEINSEAERQSIVDPSTGEIPTT